MAWEQNYYLSILMKMSYKWDFWWVRFSFQTNFIAWILFAGIEIAKSQGAKYRLGPELEIRYKWKNHSFLSCSFFVERTTV